MKRVLFVFIVFLTVSCEKDIRLMSIEVAPVVEAYTGYQTTLYVSCTPAEAVAPGMYYYKSNDEYVASVDKEGVIVGHHVGTCTITVATADKHYTTKCEVKVVAQNNLYEEPIVDFSLTRASVKLEESGKTILYDTETVLVYKGEKSPVKQIMYMFDDSKKLISSGVQLETGWSSELTGFLAERYDAYGSGSGNGFSVWKGKEMEVVSKTSNDADFIVYNRYPDTKTYANSRNMIEIIGSIK